MSTQSQVIVSSLPIPAFTRRPFTPTLTTETILVTPEIAQEFLDNQIETNRPIRDGHVRALEASMRKGLWMLNGESIKFNQQGKMIDGQHRCCAIIRSKMTIPVLVVRDVLQEAFGTFDGAAKRSVSDYIVDTTNRMMTAAAARWLYFYETGQPITNSYSGVVSVPEVWETYKRHPQLEESVKLCARIRLGNGSFMAFLHYLYTNILKVSPKEDVTAFFTGIADGKDLSSKSSCFQLRETLVKAKMEKKSLNRIRLAALTLKALKIHMSGKPVNRLKWLDSEEFPSF